MVLDCKGSPNKPKVNRGLPTPFFFVFVALSLLVLTPLFTSEVSATVNGTNALNLTDWDTQMSYALGFDDEGFVGGIALTLILVCLLVLPVVMLTRSKKNDYTVIAEMVMMFLGLVGGVAFQWVSYWVLLVVIMIVALLYSARVKEWVSSGGG